MKTISSRRLVVVLAAGALGLATAGPATADPPVSSLVADQASVALDIVTATSAPVLVDLDANCLNAMNNGQAFGIVATSANTAVATVAPGSISNLHCADAAKSFSIATHAFSAALSLTDPVNVAACAAVGSTSVGFAPVVGAPGLQKKLHGTTVGVSVSDSTNACAGGGGGGGGGGSGTNPAAPAVANEALNNSQTLSSGCKSHFGNSKSWRGSTISYIADWMPKPESIKDRSDVTDLWTAYVVSELNHLCLGDATNDQDITGIVGLTPYAPPLP